MKPRETAYNSAFFRVTTYLCISGICHNCVIMNEGGGKLTGEGKPEKVNKLIEIVSAAVER